MGERCYACGHRLRKAKSRFREDLGPAKVYAVLVGRDAPRICYTFEEFHDSMSGFSGASGKAFGSVEDARIWIQQNAKEGKRTRIYEPPMNHPFTSNDSILGDYKTNIPITPRKAPLKNALEDEDLEMDLSSDDYESKYFKAFEDAKPSKAPPPSSTPPKLSRTYLHPLYDWSPNITPVGGFLQDPKKACAVPPVPGYQNRNGGPQWLVRMGISSPPIRTPPPFSKENVDKFAVGLSVEQKQVLELVNEGKSIFLTGAAGTGKSVTLRAIIKMLQARYDGLNEALAVTASTGIAGINIGGQTLHSFCGLGLAKESLQTLINRCRKYTKIKDRWNAVITLVIDEISMIDGSFFDKLEPIARVLRRNNKPFGGIQLIVCGDFFQLPPVPDHYQSAMIDPAFTFDATSWRRCIDLEIRLTKVFRQADSAFVNILNRMRVGAELDHEMLETIKTLERSIDSHGIEPVHLYPLNIQVNKANRSRLNSLPGEEIPFFGRDQGRWEDYDFNDKSRHDARIANLLDKFSLAPRKVGLKEGAQVMLVRNLVPRTFVNGSLGRVVGFVKISEAKRQGVMTATWLLEEAIKERVESGEASSEEKRSLEGLQKNKKERDPFISEKAWPLVEFINGYKALLNPLPFDTQDAFGHLEATRTQVPLILAWAITVHKSQGQTIERLKIDFAGTFERGQAYVAMSRATGLANLQVLNFDPALVKVHPRVLQWDSNSTKEEEMDFEDAVMSYYSEP